MTTGSILKETVEGGRRWVCDHQECGDNLPERRVRFDLTSEQEMKADRPYRPLGKRKEKKVRKGKRKISAETWCYIHRLLQEDDCVTEAKLVKHLSINNEETVEELDTGGKDEPKPESEQTPTSTVSLQECDQATIINNFMKRWGKILKLEIKIEGSRYGSKGDPKEPARQPEE